MASPELPTSLLRDVSRSFYLTLRVLPGAIRPQIGLAYLLARTTDTIADTELVPVEKRLQALWQLRDRILGISALALKFDEFARCQSGSESDSVSPAERLLLPRLEQALAMLQTLSTNDQQQIRTVLATIISGQELDLRRFGWVAKGDLASLQSKIEFDDYTYRVAGCVGEFWTNLCRAHLFPAAVLDEGRLADSIRFGRGLQMVNILRDLPRDLRAGRCYLPSDALAARGLLPKSLLDASNEPKFRPLYHELLAEAHAHLAAGWEYTNALPYRCVRLRLACAWPALIGVRTLQRLRTGNALDGHQRIKVSRGDVRQVMWRTAASCWWPSAWGRLFSWAERDSPRVAGGT
jgi:farnesyl-diphosphate farnesyltransferase